MTKNYAVTGEERKQMVQVVSREVGIAPIYTRMPECAYVIDNIKISREGELIWDERTEDATIERIEAALAAAGFTAKEPAKEEGADETEEAVNEEAAEEEGKAEGLSFSFPRPDFTELALANLKALVASKATLIRKSLQTDRLDIEIDDEKVTFPWWDTVPAPEQTAAYGKFLAALTKMAKEARRANPKERETESEKYSFRIFLLRMGFSGPEHKETRAILMKHLSGHAAFKNQAEADAFYQRLKEKKAAEKAAAFGNMETTEAENAEEQSEEAADDEISE